MATAQTVDEAKAEAFLERVVGDFSGTMVTVLAAIGDRLGLFKDLQANGPATSQELAERAGVDERYAREWLRGLAAAGYLEYDRASDRFSLPPEHGMVFAQEGGPMFLAGGYQELTEMFRVLDQVSGAFRDGGGVPMSDYSPGFFEGLERFTASWFENLLLQQWLPALPDIEARLREGIVAADVGCGGGRASIKLAQAFPQSRFVGLDVFPGQVERARANAEAAGVADRVLFQVADAAEALPDRYDLITTFDVVHDAVDPQRLVKSIRRGLKDDGSYLMLEIACADDPADNVGPLAAMFYGFSVMYCLTTSLAHGGAGLGTCGLPEAKVREIGAEAGFATVERAPIENPFNALYVLRP
jgi:SAM-dependent methyltransferase